MTNSTPTPIPPPPRSILLRTLAIYVILAGAWVLVSAYLLLAAVAVPDDHLRLKIVGDGLGVIITVGLLHVLSRHQVRAIRRSEEAMRAREDHYRAILYRASQEIVASLDPEQVYAATHEAARRLMSSEAFAITLLDEERHEIEPVYLIDRSGRTTAPRVPARRGLSGHVISTGEILRIDDVERDLKMDVIHFGDPESVRSVLAVPMRRGDKIFGVLIAQSYRPNAYTPNDEQMLVTLANQAASAIANARLFESERAARRQAEALLATSNAVSSSLDRATVLTRLAEQMARTINVTSAYICDYEPGSHRSTVLAEYLGPDASPLERVSDLGTTYDLQREFPGALEILSEGVPDVRHQDDPRLSESERAHLRRYGACSTLTLPIQIRGQTIGYVELWETRDRREFTSSEIALCQGIAQQAAVAFENARLFESERRRAEVLAALHQIGLDLSAQLDLPTLLRTIVERAARLLSAPIGGLYLLLPDEQTLELVVSHNLGAAYTGTRLQLGEGQAGKIAQTGQPSLVGNYRTWPGRASAFDAASIGALVGVPIQWQGKVLGVINVGDATPDRFRTEDVDVLSLFANQAAAAIANARLFEAERRQRQELEAVYRASLSLASSLELSHVLDALLNAVRDLASFQDAHIFLYDRECLTFGAAITPEGRISRPYAEPRPQGLTYTVARSGETVIVDDTGRHPLFATAPADWDRFAIVGLPLKIGPTVVGVMNVAYRKPHHFTESELRIFNLLAAQAAIAIHNARLHEQVQSHAAELEQRVAERTAELDRQRRRMQAILDAAGEGITLTDADFRIEYINPAMERLTGYIVDEARGQKTLWRSGLTSSDVYDDMRRTLSGGEVWRGEIVNRRKNGELYDALLTVNPLKSEDGEVVGYVGVQRDITRQKELDRLKDQFVSNVSHELRTPLANVKLYIDLLERGRAEKREQYMQTLQREAARLEVLINNLLDLSRLDLGTAAIDWRPTDLNRLAADLIHDRSALAAERDLSLESRLTPHLPLTLADTAMVAQVMSNLVANAVNYTPPGGQVTVSTAVRRRDSREWVTFTVQDTGPGISAEDRSHLFERFFRGAAARSSGTPGTGLGLAISKEIVGKLDGLISVESQPGEGAAFTVWLRLPSGVKE